ncbi:MAG: Na/Pi cotransporter family protein [Deltaproteobacteria bacterium]|nr:Na/Pi cotransporter family protein [Deltaproteobacteria bacterium]
MTSFSLISFLGAIAIFIYGIRQSRIGIQLLAGNRLRRLVSALTENRFSALLTGVLVTLILQSSVATTVMLIGFATSGVLSLQQAMGVILGADIGTAFVVILLSIRQVAEYALLMLVTGIFIDIFFKSKKIRYLSMIVMGFGFVFLGMQLMVQITTPLRENHFLVEIFNLLSEKPSYSFLLAIGFTALVQNSATTLGLTIAMALSQVIDMSHAVPLVLGANVGTCAMTFLHGARGGAPARQVALAHLFFKLSGASVALVFLANTVKGVEWLSSLLSLSGNVAGQIALSHVCFNLALSVFFLPFIRQGAWIIRKVVPIPPPGEDLFGPKYLSEDATDSPALAFANVKREILRMGEIACEMFRDLIEVFEKDDPLLIEMIEEKDDKVDILDREIKFYLAKISQEAINPEQGRLELSLVAMTSDFEEIGDIINKNILELAQKKIHKGRVFSGEGWKEIQDLHSKVLENFQLALSTLTTEDESLARKIVRHEKHLEELESRYREGHLQRLHRGIKEAFETSSIHLDLLSNFRRVNTKLMMIVKSSMPGKEIE